MKPVWCISIRCTIQASFVKTRSGICWKRLSYCTKNFNLLKKTLYPSASKIYGLDSVSKLFSHKYAQMHHFKFDEVRTSTNLDMRPPPKTNIRHHCQCQGYSLRINVPLNLNKWLGELKSQYAQVLIWISCFTCLLSSNLFLFLWFNVWNIISYLINAI